jgi:acyl-CoA dehydrogenase
MTAASQSARQSAEDVLPVLRRHAAEVDAAARFPTESVAALRECGLFGLLAPVEFGGLGGDLGDMIAVADRLAGGCLSTAMIWAMHCQQVDAVVRFGSAEMRENLLRRVAKGDLYLASVTTETGKGGHLLSAQAALTADADMLRIARTAPVVTGGDYADGFLITMRADVEARDGQVSLVFADRSQLALEPSSGWNPLGMRGTHSVGLTISGDVPASQVVGPAGGFREVAVESMIPAGHLGWSACWLGAARSGLADFIALLRSPKRPRGVDLQSDLVAERLARTRIDLELASAYLHRMCDEVLACRRAGASLDTPATQIHLNTLKVVAAEHSYSAVDRLVQLAGLSLGYMKDAAIPLERHLRDLRSAALNNSNDRLLAVTGKLALLDRGVRLA